MSEWPTIKIVHDEVEQSGPIWSIFGEEVQTSLPPGEYLLIPKHRIRKEWLCTKRGAGRFCDTNDIFHVRCGFVLIVEADDE